MIVVRPLLATNTNYSKTTDKSTHNKLMSRGDGLYRVISVQRHTPTTDENGVPNAVSIYWSTAVPSGSTIAGISHEQIAIEGQGSAVNNERQAPKGKVAMRKRCDTEETLTLPRPKGNKKATRTHRVSPKFRASMTKMKITQRRSESKRKGDIQNSPSYARITSMMTRWIQENAR